MSLSSESWSALAMHALCVIEIGLSPVELPNRRQPGKREGVGNAHQEGGKEEGIQREGGTRMEGQGGTLREGGRDFKLLEGGREGPGGRDSKGGTTGSPSQQKRARPSACARRPVSDVEE